MMKSNLQEMRSAFYSGAGKEEDPRVAALDAEALTRENYARRMQLLLWAEEHQERFFIRFALIWRCFQTSA